jgi:hypothetical protein
MKGFQGRAGEKAFSYVCSVCGATCNPSLEDEQGWDFIVEFQSLGLPGISADLQQQIPAALVQVKTKERRGLSVRMKLSNALKLVRSQNPAFVVLATYSENGSSPTWHATHLWDQFMAQTLKRAREKSRDGVDEKDFNKSWISFSLNGADAKGDTELLDWMEATIRHSGDDYAAAKRAVRDRVGFDGADLVGTMQIGPIGSLDELIDHQLGLTPTIPLQKIILSQRRFGIDIALPLPNIPSYARLRANPVGQCQVRVRGPDGIEFETCGDLIVAGVQGHDADQTKIRVKTPVLDIVSGQPSDSTISCEFATDQTRVLAELEQILRLLSWSGQGDIDVQVFINDAPLLAADVELPELPDRVGYAWLAQMIGPLVQVSQHLRNRTASISIEDMLICSDLEPFFRFVRGDEMNANAATQMAELPEIDHSITLGQVTVGSWSFGALVRRPLARQTLSEGTWSIKFGKPILLERYAWPVADGETPPSLENDYARHCAKPGALGIGNALAFLNRVG